MLRCLLVVLFLAGPLQGCAEVGSVLVDAFAPSRVTRLTFNKIYSGMSFEQVLEILGEPTLTQGESETMGVRTSIYTWAGEGSQGANITVIFQNGKVFSKAHFGLR